VDGHRSPRDLALAGTGGPAVGTPERKGFGSKLIEQTSEGKARLEFTPDGVVRTMEFSLAPRALSGKAGLGK
jgi:hypothetical protein